ncbi:hypothetical protein GCM10028833_41790 [Glycomyces tarimensis]
MLALLLGKIVPLALERHDHVGADVGFVGEVLETGAAGLVEDLVGAGGGEVVSRSGIFSPDPQKGAPAVGKGREDDRVVAVLAVPVPVDMRRPGLCGTAPLSHRSASIVNRDGKTSLMCAVRSFGGSVAAWTGY